jgi:4-amino-4-deoxy-L-arabinose transferase-like glycosyltransferase
LFFLFSLIDLFIHYFTNATFGLHRDEYLYIAMKDHLDFGYVSIPPFTSIIAKISNVLFGHSVFGYRVLPSLAGAISVFLTGLIVKELKGSYMAITIACLS